MAINKHVLEDKYNVAELLAKAEEIGKLAAAEAKEADKNGRFSDKIAKAIEEAEFHKLMRPIKYGGSALNIKTYGEIIRTVASHSVAAGWLAYFFSIHETWVSHLPPKGREEIFGQGGLVADVVAPLGKVEKDVDGVGYRLSGQWNFCSGVLWSDWVGLGAFMELPDSTEPEYCLLVVRKEDFTIVENWDTIGLRGTGSNGVLVENAYVPPHLIFPAGRVMATGQPPGGDYDINDPAYRMPFMQLFLIGFPIVALGGAQRIISLFQERTEKRVRVFKAGASEKDSAGSQRVLAELKLKLNSLEGLVNLYTETLETWKAEGRNVVSDEEREHLFALRGHVAQVVNEISVKVMLTLGGTAIFKGDPVELITRDLLALAAHPNHLYEDAMDAYGKTLFGLPGNPVW